jgi:Spy/CpxP family protein refolding chaperone
MPTRLAVVALAALLACSKPEPGPSASPSPSPSPSPYAGEETRSIKSLSPSDIEELEQGRGWGFARVAELNGVPGPLHVLELADRLVLTGEQRDAAGAIYESMKARAIPAGRRFIAAERRLSDAFAARAVTGESLEALIAESARERAALRVIHLRAHLQTDPLLTREQRARYRELRGYGAGDPCLDVPAGHDPAMWKRHHGCDDPAGPAPH